MAGTSKRTVRQNRSDGTESFDQTGGEAPIINTQTTGPTDAPSGGDTTGREQTPQAEIPSPTNPLDTQAAFPGLEFLTTQAVPVKKTGAHSPNAYTKKKRQEQAAQTTVVLLAIIEGMLTTAFGDECALTSSERDMIEPPFARIMARLNPATSAIVEKYSDPILLAVGLMAWGSRLWGIQAERIKLAKLTPKNSLEPRPIDPNEAARVLAANTPAVSDVVPLESLQVMN